MSLFQMSVAGGVLILFIVVIRALAIHRLPKTTFLALWMIAALRLLLPFSIPLPFNIHIGLDVFSDVVQELPSGNIASTLPGDSPPSYDTLVSWRLAVGTLLLHLLFSEYAEVQNVYPRQHTVYPKLVDRTPNFQTPCGAEFRFDFLSADLWHPASGDPIAQKT